MGGFIKPEPKKVEKVEVEFREGISKEEAFKKVKKAVKKSSKNKIFGLVFVVIFGVLVILVSVVFARYQSDITYFEDDHTVMDFVVESGDNVSNVAQKLKASNLISSRYSFEIYARLNGKSNIKAGKYEFSKAMTIPQILEILNNGQEIKTFSVMFLPGGTVAMAKKALVSVGFSESEVDAALSKDYSSDFSKLFAGKPASTDLEGFLYGETHIFEKGASAEMVVRRFLKDFEDKVVQLDLAKKFEKQGLSLYEGITLASIVQRETLADFEDRRMVAGVFFNRMRAGMNLGSDVTYQYIADKLGLDRDFNLDNPYNLRKYIGLTPTPIATPSLDSLKAVSDPAEHNYLFFLSGDDDVTYFGVTEEEHNMNIKKYCQKKCLII